MSFLQGPRTKLGYKLLRRKVRKLDRHKTYNNLDSAVTVGILFDATNESDIDDVKRFVSALNKEGKRVDVLGMVNTRLELGVHSCEVGFNYFAADDCNFWCYPKGVAALQFITQSFDILLNVSPGICLSTDYIVGMSKAKFKVSTRLSDEAYADFILQFATGTAADGKPHPMPSAGQIISAMKQYLSNIAKA